MNKKFSTKSSPTVFCCPKQNDATKKKRKGQNLPMIFRFFSGSSTPASGQSRFSSWSGIQEDIAAITRYWLIMWFLENHLCTMLCIYVTCIYLYCSMRIYSFKWTLTSVLSSQPSLYSLSVWDEKHINVFCKIGCFFPHTPWIKKNKLHEQSHSQGMLFGSDPSRSWKKHQKFHEYSVPMDPGSPNVKWWARGVYNHLQNARYLGSMKPFSEGDWIPREYNIICINRTEIPKQ